MIVRDLGLIEYSEALKIQEATVSQVLDLGDSHETLFVCEHPKVITLGRALGSEKEVLDKTLPVIEVTRGGRSTLHLPGQVVVYPIINLEQRNKDLHAFMRLLEEAIIDTLADFRVQAARIEGKTGVWIKNSHRGGEKKVASLGIAVKKWVSYHGLALNVACDLKVFSGLNPCGFSGDVMTSLLEELDPVYKATWALESHRLMRDVKNRLLENLQELLGRREDDQDMIRWQDQGASR